MAKPIKHQDEDGRCLQDRAVIMTTICLSFWDRLRVLLGWRISLRIDQEFWFDDQLGVAAAPHPSSNCWLWNPRAKARPMTRIDSDARDTASS